MPDTSPPAQPCAACGGTGQLAPVQIENPQTGAVTTVYPPCLACL